MNDTTAMSRLIALIRGINVGSDRKLSMADLRAACAEAGFGKVKTYIRSGNLVLDHDDVTAVEFALEKLISRRFGLDVPVIARSATAWKALIASWPLFLRSRSRASEASPSRMQAAVCRNRS